MDLVSLKFAMTLAMLLHSSYKDLRTREIELGLWLAYGAPLLVLAALELTRGYLPKDALLMYVLGIVLILGLTLPLYFFNMFGGADVICLLILAVTTPVLPLRKETMFPPSLLVLFYSVMFALSVSIYFLFVNISRKNYRHLHGISLIKKAILLFIGIPLEARVIAKKRFWYPLQITRSSDIRLHFDIDVDDSELRRKIEEQIERGEMTPSTLIWSTYGIPTIPFIFLGYLAANLIGDSIIRLLFR